MPRTAESTGVRESIAGAVAFIGGIVLEKFFSVTNATLAGFVIGTVLIVDGLRREPQGQPDQPTE